MKFPKRSDHPHLLGIVLLWGLCCLTGAGALAAETLPLRTVVCQGEYRHHLQGVCADSAGNIYWSFTTQLVKTDAQGKLLLQVAVANHHGDLCFHDGRIFVAVNLGEFNQPAGQANSWVYEYDAGSLKELHRFPVPEVVHGAGGMDFHDNRFYVVGGLPAGTPENYVYEYDASFQFLKRFVLASGETHLGIQTAHFHEGAWWFGCYGTPDVVLKAGPDFQMLGRCKFNCSVGLIGIDQDHFLVARNIRNKDKLNEGRLVPARVTSEGTFTLLP